MRWNILIYGCSQKGKKWKMVQLYLNFLCKITLEMLAYIQTTAIFKRKLLLKRIPFLFCIICKGKLIKILLAHNLWITFPMKEI